MYIIKILSNLEAWDKLQKEYIEQYFQISKAIEAITPEQIQKLNTSSRPYSITELARIFSQQLADAGWITTKPAAFGTSRARHAELDAVKDQIGVEIATGNRSSAESTIFVRFPISIQAARIKVGILILPSKSLARSMVDRIAVFEDISNRLHGMVPLLPKYPFAIIGISDNFCEPQIEELPKITTSTEKTEMSERHLRVFLCHSSGDKPAVRELYKRLVARKNIDPWLDEVKLLPGVNWNNEITRAVKESDVVVVCLSKASVNKEGYVQKEIRRALDVAEEKPDGTIFIIPLRIEECEVPQRLSQWQWVDYYEDGAFDKLLSALKRRAKSLEIEIG